VSSPIYQPYPLATFVPVNTLSREEPNHTTFVYEAYTEIQFQYLVKYFNCIFPNIVYKNDESYCIVHLPLTFTSATIMTTTNNKPFLEERASPSPSMLPSNESRGWEGERSSTWGPEGPWGAACPSSICRPRKIRYKHRAFQDALYDLVLTGKTIMNSGKLRHEMSMLLDYLHIGVQFTTIGTTGGQGSQLGFKLGGRAWNMEYIFNCIRKKKIGKQNIMDVRVGFEKGLDVEHFAECITRTDITFEEFDELSVDSFWASPYGLMPEYCPYGYIKVNRLVRQLALDTVITPDALATLTGFITNMNTFEKKAAKYARA
jgi:hypothetical protein